MQSDLRKDILRYSKKGARGLFDPSLVAVAAYRFGQWCRRCRIPVFGPIFRAIHVVLHSVITILIGIYLPRSASIGPGLLIYHFGGIWVHPNAVIGRDCTLRNNVCIGAAFGGEDAPIIGDNVEFGVGVVIVGKVHIGNNARIGANAVVLTDVPDNSTAFGVPASLLPKVPGGLP